MYVCICSKVEFKKYNNCVSKKIGAGREKSCGIYSIYAVRYVK